MHRFVAASAARPSIGFAGRPQRADAPWRQIVARARSATLAKFALVALVCALGLWRLVTIAPETPFSAQLPRAESASVSAPAWLAPLSESLSLAGANASPADSLPAAREEVVKGAYARLPLSFVENQGQVDGGVRYYVQGQGFGFYFTRDKVVLSFTKGRRGTALHLTPLGASPKARLVATRPGSGRVNYLVGSEHHTNLATYHELAYRDLWPGIDMVFRGQGGRLKYEFQVAPGADPSRIRLAYRGAGGLSLGRGGELLIKTPLGTLRDSRPRSYQRIRGERGAIKSSYALRRGGSTYGFALGASYDPRRRLVIDPSLVYSTLLGGDLEDTGGAVAVDASGSAYVTGVTATSDFPTTPGAFDRTFGGGVALVVDAFVAKLNAAGSALVYSTFLGGNDFDISTSIAVDAGGSAYVTGFTASSDFPTTAGAFDRAQEGDTDAFVTKLNGAGSALAYSTFLGGRDFEDSASIAVDPGGNAYVTGASASADFPTTAGAFDRSLGDGAVFVTKLNPAGSALGYSTFLGGNTRDGSGSIEVDAVGSAYVTGLTDSGDFPTTPGAFDRTLGGDTDVFITKLNAAGSALGYSTFLGGSSSSEVGRGIAVDAVGNAYVTGESDSPDFPTTPGAFDRTPGSNVPFSTDAYVTKLNPAGSALGYSTLLGGSDTDGALDIGIDQSGRTYVTGATQSPDFPATPGAFDRTLGGGLDAFVTKLNTAGSALAYSTYLGGSLSESSAGDVGTGIAIDATGSAYVTGSTASSDFPTTPGVFDRVHAGQFEAFITKFNLNQCSDGRDNDGDGKIDFPADPGCSSASDDDERDAAPAFPTSKEQCKNGGWRNFPGFKNQGDCVSFVATRGKNPPAGS
jgi:hypothetical protein